MLHKVEGLFPEDLFEGTITAQDIFRQQVHRIVEDIDIEELEKLFTMELIHPRSDESEEKINDLWGDETANAEIMHLRDTKCFKVRTQINIK